MNQLYRSCFGRLVDANAGILPMICLRKRASRSAPPGEAKSHCSAPTAPPPVTCTRGAVCRRYPCTRKCGSAPRQPIKVPSACC